MLERALERLTESPLVGTAASRFMGRIVGEVLQANRAVTDKVPGLGALMSFGTSAASKVVGAADKQFEGLIGDTVGKGGTFAVRRLNKIVIETLRDPTTREAVLQVWDLLAAGARRRARPARDPRGGHRRRRRRARAGHRHRRRASTSPRLTEVVVDAFLDRFGGYTPTELLDELDLSREDVVADLVRIAPGVVDALRESGDLERILRAELEPFYSSPEVTALLGGRRDRAGAAVATQDPGGPAYGAALDAQVGVALEQRPQPDLALHPREGGAEAVVPAGRERDVVAGVLPGDVEAVRVREHRGVAVGPGEHRHHHPAPRDRCARRPRGRRSPSGR